MEYIFLDGKVIIWLAHNGAFLTSFDPKSEKFTRYAFPDSLHVPLWTTCIMEDRDGYLWIGTNQGLIST
ncbi:MAG: hypothetical protein IPL46_30860 [Saprospiraceae bacterium]|nr:hypothetical protein [Saprospiraceae bacterium]